MWNFYDVEFWTRREKGLSSGRKLFQPVSSDRRPRHGHTGGRRFLLILFFFTCFFLVLPQMIFAGPPFVASTSYPNDSLVSGPGHFALAEEAVQGGDCDRLRHEFEQSVRLGLAPDRSMVAKWGFICGRPLGDGAFRPQKLSALAVSGSGRIVAAARADGRVLLHDLSSSTSIFTWNTGLSEVSDLDVSPDGALVAVGGDRRVAVLRVDKKKEIWSGDMGAYISRVRFSFDGRGLVIGMNKMSWEGGQDPSLTGMVRYLSLSDPAIMVNMKSVPGNPVGLAITNDGKKVVGFCWPEKYTFHTVSTLLVWNAQTGEVELDRQLRTSPKFNSSLSRDGRILVYSRLAPEVLSKNKRRLDRDGRMRNVQNLKLQKASSWEWLHSSSSYSARAHSVFEGIEVSLLGGLVPLAIDGSGKRVVMLSRSGEPVCEEVGSGNIYKIGLSSDGGSKRPLAGFSGNGRVLVMGSTNSDLSRFGWLASELGKPKRMAGPVAR